VPRELGVPRGPADRLLAGLRAVPSVLLTGPADPDGDSVGACLAFAEVLRRLLPDARVGVAGDPGFRYAWLPGAEAMIREVVAGDWAAVIVLDGDRHRLGADAAAAFQAAAVRGIVDHHASTRADGYTHAWIDPTAASTCEMVATALSTWGLAIDAALATALYVGMIFDTGGFRFSNTSPATHRLAAEVLESGIDHAAINARVLMDRREPGLRLAGSVFGEARFALNGRVVFGRVRDADLLRFGAVSGDLEGVVESLLYVVGVEVAVLGIERSGGTKLSFRSRGLVDVQALAHDLVPSGGGHKKAAGAFVPWELDEAERRVTDALTPLLAG
jgi:phosphoesterase RecJ-like protein